MIYPQVAIFLSLAEAGYSARLQIFKPRLHFAQKNMPKPCTTNVNSTVKKYFDIPYIEMEFKCSKDVYYMKENENAETLYITPLC